MWADQLAEALASIVTAFIIAQALMWFGLDNFIIAAAIGVAIVFLLPNFAAPVRRLVKGIVVEIFKTIQELLEFLATWLRAVAEHFQGNIVRAILRIVVLAAFMWIWNLAQGIPAIKQIIDTVVELGGRLTAYVNNLFDKALGFITDLRNKIVGLVDHVLGRMGELGKVLRGEILTIVDSLFGGLRKELQQLRFQLLAQTDFVRQLVALEVEIFGQRFKLLPDEVRKYLLTLAAAAERDAESQLRRAVGGRPAIPVSAAAPWVIANVAEAELEAAVLGVAGVQGAAEDPLESELRALVPQAPGYLQGWLNDQIARGIDELRRFDTSTRAIADRAVEDLRAVLAGRPPVIPDLPRELIPTPSTPPPAPEK